MEIVNYSIRNPNHVKNIEFIPLMRAVRTRTRTDGNFWNAQYDQIRTQNFSKSDFEQFKILTRAHVRVGQELSVCWPMTWSLCVLNLINSQWMVMKIWITWKLKMAPGWRHGWVITLKRGGARFLMMPKILWKFEDSDTFFEINESQN